MKHAPTKTAPQPAPQAAPNPDKGVKDSAERTEFTSPPRRLGTSQDFGDRETSHTDDALRQRAPGAPSHGTPRSSPEEKRSWNPD